MFDGRDGDFDARGQCSMDANVTLPRGDRVSVKGLDAMRIHALRHEEGM